MRLRALATVVFTATFALLVPTTADADEPLPPLPVGRTFLDGLANELGSPNGHAAGTNDWNCAPSAEHPDPVVLVHGTVLNRQDNWSYLAPLLANEGYCVFALTYGNHPNLSWPLNAVGGMLPMEQSAQQLALFVDQVRAATGAEKVDLVGHSQGTLMPLWYVNFLGGNETVDDYVSLGPVYEGSHAFLLAASFELFEHIGARKDMEHLVHALGCGACPQVLAGSDWIETIQRAGVYADEVTYTNIMTRYEEIVLPYTSGYREAPNATNIVLQDHCADDFVEHAGIVNDPNAAWFVLDALDPDDPRPLQCVFVPPILGWSPDPTMGPHPSAEIAAHPADPRHP
ncbi:esterase/lipase family protein [Rhodococcus chondri]|uniref:Alpha/beta fold hydrolase n=1 Tax=Rhodococcus chondri TaxID=3065941 RepID=A0ABU7JPM3_9NOCA|nr:alpha/beta fold hydrolase [Rhodococcus sp. CC-R104]MEE2031980.1 alpha/beta fold hydrolase [Rhodococcus sp. CC-R104]